jgi:STE24 endopeptidase
MALDAVAATSAYIDALGPAALTRASAYTLGNHWLLLWGLLFSAAVTWVMVRGRVLERVDSRLSRRGRNLRTGLLSVAFFLLSGVLTLPWSIYENWWRERAYGRSSQPLADFLTQGLLSLVLSAALAGLFFIGIYALMRRAGRSWWVWSGALAAGTLAVLLLVSPILIEPLFNDFKPVPEGKVRDALYGMAYEAGIAGDSIFVYDGSRQSNNFTANVAGLGASARIAISDVAFKGASLDEVKAVTAHEIGHYVLDHVWRSVLVLSVLATLAFLVADRVFPLFARAFGSRATLADPVGLPVLLVVVSLLGVLAQPVTNGLSRLAEIEADRYSLETVNLPDALASALVKTAEYRDPRPHVLQEWLFYTHPSVERRVRRAMDWKASRESALP